MTFNYTQARLLHSTKLPIYQKLQCVLEVWRSGYRVGFDQRS